MENLKAFLLILIIIISRPIIAHPGHGLESNELWHYLLSPAHFVIIIFTSALIYLAVRVKTDKKQRDA